MTAFRQRPAQHAHAIEEQFAEHAARLDLVLSHVKVVPPAVAHHWLTMLRAIDVRRPLEGERMIEAMLGMHDQAFELYRPKARPLEIAAQRTARFDTEMESIRSGLEWLGRILAQVAERPAAA